MLSQPRWFSRNATLATLPILFLAATLAACGAPEEMEDELDSEKSAEALGKPCLKGEPCGPLVPLPPPTPKRTYCCDYGTSVSWTNTAQGRRVDKIEGWGCRNLNESKSKDCIQHLQITCNGFAVERLEGGHLTCIDPI